jgi:hypothetical protein
MTTNELVRFERLVAALEQCKRAVELQNMPYSSRCELVRDIATPVLVAEREERLNAANRAGQDYMTAPTPEKLIHWKELGAKAGVPNFHKGGAK